jgi:hypothetical protein
MGQVSFSRELATDEPSPALGRAHMNNGPRSFPNDSRQAVDPVDRSSCVARTLDPALHRFRCAPLRSAQPAVTRIG